MKSHEDLEVWKIAVALATRVYHVTRTFPDEEKFGMISQMRRAAVSIPSNIAEGAARQGRKEFAQFLSVAAGSASELATQLVIAKNIGLGDQNDLETLSAELDRISRMLQGLIRRIKVKD